MKQHDVIDDTLSHLGISDYDEVRAAILSALSAAGFKVVPVEATEAMVEVGHDKMDWDDFNDDFNRRVTARVYRAMVEAAE